MQTGKNRAVTERDEAVWRNARVVQDEINRQGGIWHMSEEEVMQIEVSEKCCLPGADRRQQ